MEIARDEEKKSHAHTGITKYGAHFFLVGRRRMQKLKPINFG